MILGVYQGVREDLDAEPMIAEARRRLVDAGLSGVWIHTHYVRDAGGTRCAYTVDVPDDGPSPDPAALVAVVADAFAPLAQVGHDHPVAQEPASVWGPDASAGPPEGMGPARLAVDALASGTGRAAVFPGVEALVGTIPVEQVTRASAIDEVVSLAGAFAPDTPLTTRDHVRPLLRGGRWVLPVQPARGGVLVPFENPVQHRCCSAH